MKNQNGAAVMGLIFMISMILVVVPMIGGTHQALTKSKKNRLEIERVESQQANNSLENSVSEFNIQEENLASEQPELFPGERVLNLQKQIEIMELMVGIQKGNESFENNWLVRSFRWVVSSEKKTTDKMNSSDDILLAIQKFKMIDQKPCEDKIIAIRDLVEAYSEHPKFEARCEGESLIYNEDFIQLSSIFLDNSIFTKK